jgi:hypothetical protein
VEPCQGEVSVSVSGGAVTGSTEVVSRSRL